MRIWSLHPKYLDAKGLVALWRETLLAKNVLKGKTKGYINHPQLYRFKQTSNPLEAIDFYLYHIWNEAHARNYKFDKSKFNIIDKVAKIAVTKGQVDFEREHLLKKLKIRDTYKYNKILVVNQLEVHPLFILKKGDIEPWEKT